MGKGGIIRMAVHRTRRGVPPPPPRNTPCPQAKVAIVGKHEICRWENLAGPFLVHTLLGPIPPPSNTSSRGIRTAVHLRRRGVNLPGHPPPQHFALALLAPRGFKPKTFWPAFSGDHRGTIGGGGSQPTPPPFQTPPPPFLIPPCFPGRGVGQEWGSKESQPLEPPPGGGGGGWKKDSKPPPPPPAAQSHPP